MKNATIDELNTKLAGRYGKSLNGQQYFRIVWSTDITEKRYGTFLVYHNDIIVGNITEVRETRKYNYINNRWLLERFNEKNTVPSLVLPEPDGYDCIYVFEDSKGNALPIKLEIIELIVFTILNPMSPQELKQSIEDSQLQEVAKEEAYFEQMFSENSSYDLHKRHHGERISNAGIISLIGDE